MRILKIRFKNLNSLAGEWEIDLAHPAFASDGIFAITGPTGAGKTTILDAICLALYGRTPRLNRINRNGNEIMSRQTGECFAEVVFETQTGRYRCHWSQHRARKRPDGDLQQPKQEIANADTGEIFETKMRGVAEQIEDATGMDFERFTRSMLLAQGDFAAFLQASPDDRAPILEQITGTEIYSRISIRVHERRSKEHRKLETLQSELAGIQILTPEEEQELDAGLKQKTGQDIEYVRQITSQNAAITWIEAINKLEKELKLLDEQKADLNARMEAFVPEQERLEAATRALELAGDYASLTTLRTAQESDRVALEKNRELLPACEGTASAAASAMQIAEGQLDAIKSEQMQTQPILRKVRELDLKLADKAAPINAAQASIADLSASFALLREKQNKDFLELKTMQASLANVQQKLEETAADAELVENLAGIKSRFAFLQTLHKQLTEKRSEIERIERLINESVRESQDKAKNLEDAKGHLQEIQESLSLKKAEIRAKLENRDLGDWRKSQSLLRDQKDLFDFALVATESLSKSKQVMADLDVRTAALIGVETELKSLLANQIERSGAFEKEAELLETQLALLKKIENLEEFRCQLQDGEPCPLCGSKEHPFAEGNVPAADETRQRFNETRDNLKSANKEISSLKIKLAKIERDIEQATAELKEHAAHITSTRQRLDAILVQLPSDMQIDASSPDLEETLRGLQASVAQLLDHASKIIETAEDAEKKWNALRDAQEAAMDGVAQAELAAQSARQKIESTQQLSEQLAKDEREYADQLNGSLSKLQNDLQAFGVEALSIEAFDAIQEWLTTRRERWTACQKEKSELEIRSAAIEMQIGYQADRIQTSENELQRQTDQLAGLIQEQDSFASERKNVFGDRNPDEEEARLSASVVFAEKKCEAARQNLAIAKQEFAQLEFRIAELEKGIALRKTSLQLSEERFLARLSDSGFPDESNFTAACLPESERKHLAQQSQKLSIEKNEITSKEMEKTKNLQTEREKRITIEPLDELVSARTVLVAAQKELQQEIGGIRQKLKSNEDLKLKQQKRVEEIHKQQKECARWDLLYELIGSADGKKYRNFAQGLTFEMMIGHANRQLQKMTDRYLLIRDEELPLELNVIDSYQAGEVRSTKNLSGGESFIVSLSLALGLSHMASQNVRIDSLFLDEGFGALDEEALDVALETLAGLQQDGKMIGVISHVSALKERISAQIQVAPQAGGRSCIEGPGCAHLI